MLGRTHCRPGNCTLRLPACCTPTAATQLSSCRARPNPPSTTHTHSPTTATTFFPALSSQVHDEVILEGPKETAEQARARVVACMRSPFSGLTPKPLLVDLVVDAKHADTWYEAK